MQNRVRNELIPLLEDLVGGPDILEKRVQHLTQQAQDVREDLEPRVEEYLKSRILESTSHDKMQPYYKVESKDDPPVSSLIRTEALHRWISNQLPAGLSLSYESLHRLNRQLDMYPDRIQ
jgi:hypothetical protein